MSHFRRTYPTVSYGFIYCQVMTLMVCSRSFMRTVTLWRKVGGRVQTVQMSHASGVKQAAIVSSGRKY